VSGTGILSHYYGTQVADGFFHSFSGWAIYVVAFLMLFGVGWILDRFKPKSLDKKGNEPIKKDEHPSRDKVVVPNKPIISAGGTE
jgi:hypothetical protein